MNPLGPGPALSLRVKSTSCIDFESFEPISWRVYQVQEQLKMMNCCDVKLLNTFDLTSLTANLLMSCHRHRHRHRHLAASFETTTESQSKRSCFGLRESYSNWLSPVVGLRLRLDSLHSDIDRKFNHSKKRWNDDDLQPFAAGKSTCLNHSLVKVQQ